MYTMVWRCCCACRCAGADRFHQEGEYQNLGGAYRGPAYRKVLLVSLTDRSGPRHDVTFYSQAAPQQSSDNHRTWRLFCDAHARGTPLSSVPGVALPVCPSQPLHCMLLLAQVLGCVHSELDRCTISHRPSSGCPGVCA